MQAGSRSSLCSCYLIRPFGVYQGWTCCASPSVNAKNIDSKNINAKNINAKSIDAKSINPENVDAKNDSKNIDWRR